MGTGARKEVWHCGGEKEVSKFEQFMLLVLVCTGVFYIFFEYNSRKLEELQKKKELDEKVMAALRKEYEPTSRRYPIY